MNSTDYNTADSDLPRFSDFWEGVAHDLGNSRLRIYKQANCIKSFIDANAGTPEYLKSAIRCSFKLSNCKNLSSPISLEAVFDILGETAYTLQGQKADDLLDIELLEEIAWIISNRYKTQLQIFTDDSQHEQAENSNTRILSFPKYRLRKANSVI